MSEAERVEGAEEVEALRARLAACERALRRSQLRVALLRGRGSGDAERLS